MLNEKYLLRGRYEIQRKLGDGLSGNTYLAEDQSFDNNPCAIKELGPNLKKDSDEYKLIYDKFQEEARFLKELKGYNRQIPQLYDFFSENDTSYIIQEFIEGETLEELIRKNVRFNQGKVREILVNLLQVLVYLHSKDIIHRDIKPANIILRKETEIPVLIDFGIVKDTARTQIKNTASDTSAFSLGTDGYMAPEQFSGNTVPVSDIYSLGKTVIHLLTFIHPKMISGKQISWRNQVEGILPEFADIIDKSIQPYYMHRHENASEMLNELNTLVFPEDNEKIEAHLKEATISLPRRAPKPFPEKHQKCSNCDFFLTLKNKFCPNCAQYNILCLEPEQALLYKSTTDYFDKKILPEMSKADQFVLGIRYNPAERDDYVFSKYLDDIHLQRRELGQFSLFYDKLKVELISIIPAALIWAIIIYLVVPLVLAFFDYKISPNPYWLLAVPVLVGLTIYGFEELVKQYRTYEIDKIIKKYNALINIRQTKIKNLDGKRKKLLEKINEVSEDRRKSHASLLTCEKLIDARAKELSDWKNELKNLLAEIAGESSSENSLQNKHRDNLDNKHKISVQLHNKYSGKKLEIKLLRCNNSLQKAVKAIEMTQRSRLDIKDQLKKIIELCSRIISDLKEADITATNEGSKNIARVLKISEITTDLRQNLIEQEIELVLSGRTSDKSTPSSEFIEGIALLNAYVGVDDFYKEFETLEEEFAKAGLKVKI